MGKSSAPPPPSPQQTAAASTSTNVGTAVANAFLGNVNQNTPDGTLTYDQTGSHQWFDPYTGQSYNIPTFTATQTLSPQQQAIQNQNKGAQLNLATIANNQSGFLKDYLGKPADTSSAPGLISNPNLSTTIGGGYDTNFDRTYAGADDFSADRQRVEDALWQRGAQGRAQEDEALRTRLLNSGLREGSAAWNAEMERLGRQVADERTGVLLAGGQEQSRLVGLSRDAAQFASQQQQAQNAAGLAQTQFGNNAALQGSQFQNQARSQALSEAYAARNQPINEISALLSGSQVTQPNFVNANMPTIPTTDVAGIIGQDYQNQLGAWAQQQSTAGDIWGNLIGGAAYLGKGFIPSDDRIKTDKERLGNVEGEMGLWSYRLKGEPKTAPKHLGLMASEVQKVNPSAVKRDKDGIRHVNYPRALGLIDAGNDDDVPARLKRRTGLMGG